MSRAKTTCGKCGSANCYISYQKSDRVESCADCGFVWRSEGSILKAGKYVPSKAHSSYEVGACTKEEWEAQKKQGKK